jgi:hypothetical protein
MTARIRLREKYHFDDFTESAYRECLQLAAARYRFIPYAAYKDQGQVCLWRHDIDTSPQRALALGKIEAQENVNSTFFFLFHSDRYNAFDYEIKEIMLTLIDMGHHIGLHFDPIYYENNIKNSNDFEKYLIQEKDLLSDITQTTISAFSFHNPAANKLLNIDNDIIGGMVNAYSGYIKKNFAYCSDSFCYWRYQRLIDVLHDESIEKLHILTHPVCWTPDSLSPYMRFKRAVDGRAKHTLQRYLNKAKDHNRKIIR